MPCATFVLAGITVLWPLFRLQPPQPMGIGSRAVIINDPGTTEDGFDPKGTASVCLEGPPRRQCYTAPEHFGRYPRATAMELQKGLDALWFSVASGGVSGYEVHYALLIPGANEELVDLFSRPVKASNQSQTALLSDSVVSPARIVVIADVVWGPDESHHGPHRFIISAYVLRLSSDLNESRYFLQDRYMTTGWYRGDAGADIVKAEQRQILSRLKQTVRIKPPWASAPSKASKAR